MTNALRCAALALLILGAAPSSVAIAGMPPVPASTLQPVPDPVVMAATDPAGAPAGDLTSILAIAISVAAALLAAASVVLHVVAPRTKTLVDDHWRDKIDELLAFARQLPVASPPGAGAIGGTQVANAPISMPIPGPGRWRTPGVMLIALLLGGMATQVACATVKATAVAAGRSIVECAKEDVRAEIAGVTAQLGAEAATSAIDLGAIGWPELEAAAWSHGKIVGGCALAEFVGAWSIKHPDVQGLVAATDPGREALARLSARWGGVEWRTGTVR